MSFKSNIFANYVSQIYVTLIGIAMLPLYVKYMGAEAYGLVGFFAMLQAWFNLLDMGLTPTMARETARFRGGATDPLSYRRLVRALEGVFLTVALVGGTVMFCLSGYIAQDWLQASQISVAEIQVAVKIMALIIAMRWMCGLYRGAISGSERLIWLSSFNSIIGTLRFIGVLPVLIFVGVTPTLFFSYQLAVAFLELTGLVFYAYRLLPGLSTQKRIPWEWSPLKAVLNFSMTVAFTSLVWVFVTQTDKLVLSKILPLADYGYFTLAVLVASGVMVISGPVSSAVMPRMARLEAEGDQAGLIRVYRQATQLVSVIAGAASTTLALCAEPLLWVWTGNHALALEAAPVLSLYALGNGVLAVAAFPYYLQYAKGDLRLHLFGNIGFAVTLIPTIIWATTQYGAVGAGYVWLVVNVFSFIAWLPIIHHKFEPGLNRIWYAKDVLVIFLAAGTAALCINLFPFEGANTWTKLIKIILTGMFATVAGVISSSFARASLRTWYENR